MWVSTQTRRVITIIGTSSFVSYSSQEYFRIYFAADFILNAAYTLVIAIAFPFFVYRVTPLQGDGEVARRVRTFVSCTLVLICTTR